MGEKLPGSIKYDRDQQWSWWRCGVFRGTEERSWDGEAEEVAGATSLPDPTVGCDDDDGANDDGHGQGPHHPEMSPHHLHLSNNGLPRVQFFRRSFFFAFLLFFVYLPQ